MPSRILCVLAMLLTVAPLTTVVRAEVTAAAVLEAIQGGQNYLLSQQHPTRGNWPEHQGQPGGMTALCVLALVNSGMDPTSEPVQRAVEYLLDLPLPGRTYAVSVQIMALAAVDPVAHRVEIERRARWLEASQVTDGARSGSWAYSSKEGRGDNSNAQFALLGLHEAERAGIVVDPIVWRRAVRHFQKTQSAEGGWRYYINKIAPLPVSGSMTCAGISSLIIAGGKLRERDARVEGGQVVCCGASDSSEDADAIERALQFLGRPGFFTLEGNPGSGSHWLYYLYGLERVGRLSGRRFIGGRDWYREGADLLIRRQRVLSKSSNWIGVGPVEGQNKALATCFSLLFLSKGRRPVVMAKLQHGEDPRDWNRHRGAVANLVAEVEDAWKTRLTWQTIPLEAAAPADLLEAPVLFISGSQPLRWPEAQKQSLRAYIDQGGFVLAEACDGAGCNGQAFADSFRAMMSELFPNSPLAPLPLDHPIWTAEQRLALQDLPHGDTLTVEGMQACCRTSVVLINKTVSGYWELSTGARPNDYPDHVRRQVEASLRLGQNILAYATNRQLKEKLDRPQTVSAVEQPPVTRGSLIIRSLRHGGGADEAPNAMPNLVRESRRLLQMRLYAKPELIAATDARIADHPILFMHGRRRFQFSQAERDALRTYLENGGFILANAICGSRPFVDAARREFNALAPDAELQRIPADHPMFTSRFQGFDATRVEVRSVDGAAGNASQKTTPYFEGLAIDDRICVVFTPLDLSCALQDQPATQCEGYVRNDAYRLGINMILFALQR